MLNKAILMGRLTRDPEIIKTNNGKAFAKFSLALNRTQKDANGKNVADFIECIAWGKRGEFVKQWFTKGMLAIVVGAIQSNSWQDNNGRNHVNIYINVDEMSFGETKKARWEGGAVSSSSYKAPPYITPDENEFSELGDDDGDVPF